MKDGGAGSYGLYAGSGQRTDLELCIVQSHHECKFHIPHVFSITEAIMVQRCKVTTCHETVQCNGPVTVCAGVGMCTRLCLTFDTEPSKKELTCGKREKRLLQLCHFV